MNDKRPRLHLLRPLYLGLYALLLALACMLLTPLSVAACGGLFTADSYTEQSAERLIFAVDPGKVTLYEQIRYTGSPKDFAWVLPVPALPQVDTASVELFQNLNSQTAPHFYTPGEQDSSSCYANGGSGAAAPQNSSSVNVFSGGNVGPYSYNVINSNSPQALTQWLTAHNYKIPAESQAEMQPYIAAHMFFLAMRLKGSADVQDMTPVKISYATKDSTITIPLRMATPMGKENLGVLVWIFANSRYVPQNYQALQIKDSQLSYHGDNYQDLVEQAVSQARGHGFVTEYAEPTSTLYASNQELASLKQAHSYLTRMYTSIAPAQIDLDPGFVAKTGLANVGSSHVVPGSADSQNNSCLPATTVIGIALVGGLIAAFVVMFIAIARRRRRAS